MTIQWIIILLDYLIGYKPADLTVYPTLPPPQKKGLKIGSCFCIDVRNSKD